MMKLFIAWSGTRGYQFAEAFVKFIRKVFPNGEISCFFSAEIEPGTMWFPATEKAMNDTQAILLCVTREGLHSPWMHYEVGTRIGKKKQSKVYTYLLGVQPAELSDPIGKYQALECTKEGTRHLVEAISGMHWQELKSRFQAAWPDLQLIIRKLKQYTIQELIPGFDRLFIRKTFQEPLEECRDQAWLDRYYGARQTIEKLKAELQSTDERWQTYQIVIMHELISEIDGYMREMRRYLIHEVQFNQKKNGKLDFGHLKKDVSNKKQGSGKWSDKRCEKIRQLVSQLLNPKGAPVLEVAPYFMTLKPCWYKKAFVHKIEVEIEQGAFATQEYEVKLCQSSFWDFDRIVFYLLVEKDKAPRHYKIEDLINQVKMEIEKLEARDEEEVCAMPLHYSIRALANVFKRADQKANLDKNVEDCVREVGKLIEKKKFDKGGQIQKRLDQLLESIKDKSKK